MLTQNVGDATCYTHDRAPVSHGLIDQLPRNAANDGATIIAYVGMTGAYWLHPSATDTPLVGLRRSLVSHLDR